MKNMLRRGIVATISVVVTSVLIASGAQAATPEQKDISDFLSSTRNLAHQDSLIINEQMNAAAQAWADHLAAVDGGGKPPLDPNMYQPPGSTVREPMTAYFSRNDIKSAEAKWATDNASTINNPAYNTVGTGFAVAKSGAIYLVADMVNVNPPAVMAPPAPAPVQAPIQVPAPVVIQQPEPVQAAPAEQAPAQADPAPAPDVPAPAPEASKPTAAPTVQESAKPVVTPTATPTPTETASASESTNATEPGKSVDAMRTSDNTAQTSGKGPKQAIGFGGGGLVLGAGALVAFGKPRRKETSI